MVVPADGLATRLQRLVRRHSDRLGRQSILGDPSDG